jgi:monoamine oxidase
LEHNAVPETKKFLQAKAKELADMVHAWREALEKAVATDSDEDWAKEQEISLAVAMLREWADAESWNYVLTHQRHQAQFNADMRFISRYYHSSPTETD